MTAKPILQLLAFLCVLAATVFALLVAVSWAKKGLHNEQTQFFIRCFIASTFSLLALSAFAGLL